MAQLTYNSIIFSNVNNTTPLVGTINKYTISGNLSNNVPNIAKYEAGKNKPFINAIDIDWNGIVLGDKTINTTSDIAAYISTAYETAVYAISETQDIRNDLNDNYATKSYVAQEISNAQLSGGDNEVDLSYYYTKNEVDTKFNDYTTTSQLEEQLAEKQYKINDLDVIRDGAAKGATALQSVSYASDTTYGLVKISDDYQTNENSYTALSTYGAKNLYSQLNTTIDEFRALLTQLTNRVDALESYYTPVLVSSIELNKRGLTLTGKDATETLTASIEPTNATNQNVSWSSDNTYVVTVSQTGVVTATGIGNAIITAYTTDGSSKSASCSATVVDGSLTVTGLTAQNSIINEGETTKLTVSYTDTTFSGTTIKWRVYQGDKDYSYLISSPSGNIATFIAPDISESASTYYIEAAVTATVNNPGSLETVTEKATTQIEVRDNTPITTKYYWYAGQIEPTSMTSNPTPSSEYTCNNWFELSTTLPETINQQVTGGTSETAWYAAVPTDAGFVAGADGIEDTSMGKTNTISVNGINYDVWNAPGVTAKRFTVQFYKK